MSLLTHLQEISLLKLNPFVTVDAEIHGNLISTTLSSAPPYMAISYTWGVTFSDMKFLINSQRFEATQDFVSAIQATAHRNFLATIHEIQAEFPTHFGEPIKPRRTHEYIW
jgi:hypothetical protein